MEAFPKADIRASLQRGKNLLLLHLDPGDQYRQTLSLVCLPDRANQLQASFRLQAPIQDDQVRINLLDHRYGAVFQLYDPGFITCFHKAIQDELGLKPICAYDQYFLSIHPGDPFYS